MFTGAIGVFEDLGRFCHLCGRHRTIDLKAARYAAASGPPLGVDLDELGYLGQVMSFRPGSSRSGLNAR